MHGAERTEPDPRSPEESGQDLQAIYQEHATPLFRYAMALLRDEAAVRDLLQDLFLKLARGRSVPVVAADARAYLMQMVRHAAADRHRWAKVRRRHEEDAARPAAAASELFQPCVDPDRERFRQQLEQALAGLPEDQRVVAVLKLWEGRTFEEIARLCEISPNTAASRYRYALAKLRETLKPLYEEL